MQRLERMPIPDSLKERQGEILGAIKSGYMVDCKYNRFLYEPNEIVRLKRLPDFDIPVQLKPHQIEDLKKSLTQAVVFNINKPGMGKTLETICWLKHVFKNAKDFMVLILCPKSVIETWKEQLNKYWPTWATDGHFWITNYEQLYNEERYNIATSVVWDCIVLDESHNIKSMKSKITQIVYQLKSVARHCLTGTPIKNRPNDLASQLKWLDNDSITCYTDFQYAFCDMQKDRWGWKPKGLTKNKQMQSNLQKLLEYYCVGGNDSVDCDPQYIKVKIKLDTAVKTLYKKTEGEYDSETKQRVIDTAGLLESGIKISNSIEAATRRQQLASNPQLFDPQLKNTKFEWIADWLEGTDERVIIFSKYAKTIEALEKYLSAKHFSIETIKREQSAAQRKMAQTRWANSKQALLGTYGVLKEGVDGLHEHCHYIIFIDREWNASDNEQAEGRIVRTGQTKQPVIYILQAVGTIDLLVERVQLDKGHDAQELLAHVTDEESWA